MNAARHYRKLKEVEEKKLSNRVKLLQLELEKSQKKITETKARTDAILAHRESIMDRHRKKVAESKRRDAEIQRHTELNNMVRERMTTMRRANVLQVQMNKAEEAKEVNAQSQRNEMLIAEQRRREQARADDVKKLIREQRLAGQAAREAELNRKREEARKEFHRRVEEEAARSAQSESRVSEMERMELELIANLEKAQLVQRKAYTDLEEALITSKRTILDASRSKLKDSIVDSGAVKRSPRGRKRGTPRRRKTPAAMDTQMAQGGAMVAAN